MSGLPGGFRAFNENAYNIGGIAAWYCDYPSRHEAEQVLEKTFAGGPRRGFSAAPGEPGEHRARVLWRFNEQEFSGDVLVDETLTPVGFVAEVHLGFMVFNLEGYHIPYPRFPEGTASHSHDAG